MLFQSQQILISNGIVSNKYITIFFSSVEDAKLAWKSVLDKEEHKELILDQNRTRCWKLCLETMNSLHMSRLDNNKYVSPFLYSLF